MNDRPTPPPGDYVPYDPTGGPGARGAALFAAAERRIKAERAGVAPDPDDVEMLTLHEDECRAAAKARAAAADPQPTGYGNFASDPDFEEVAERRRQPRAGDGADYDRAGADAYERRLGL